LLCKGQFRKLFTTNPQELLEKTPVALEGAIIVHIEANLKKIEMH
jgi:hypothetical protein